MGSKSRKLETFITFKTLFIWLIFLYFFSRLFVWWKAFIKRIKLYCENPLKNSWTYFPKKYIETLWGHIYCREVKIYQLWSKYFPFIIVAMVTMWKKSNLPCIPFRKIYSSTHYVHRWILFVKSPTLMYWALKYWLSFLVSNASEQHLPFTPKNIQQEGPWHSTRGTLTFNKNNQPCKLFWRKLMVSQTSRKCVSHLGVL